jgi:CubicO group peptidase (beta-lactamase class C family)
LAHPVEEAVQRLQELATFELGDANVGGVSAGVVLDGQLVWTGSWGNAHSSVSRTGTHAVYAVASVTKLFTGVMLLQLAERGLLRASDPVDLYIPEFRSVRPVNDRATISLAQLATMTGGVPGQFEGPGASHARPPVEFELAVLETLPHVALVAEPGVRFVYSNLSYALLGLACARAAGLSYHGYVQQEILAPLTMTDSGFGPAVAPVPNLARGYDLTDGHVDTETADREHRGRGYGLPAGGLYSTVNDLARFVVFLIAGHPGVLSSAALAAAHDGVVAADRDLNFGEGLGFAALRDLSGRDVATGHFGIVSGYKCGVLFDRSSRAGLVVCTNITRTGNTEDLSRGMVEILATLR